jgi:hypothetical protein
MSKPAPTKQLVLKELARREKIREEQALRPKFKIDEFCFDKQIAFINDVNKFKTAVCSRRAGKTVSCAADLIDTCLTFPDVNVAYITLNRRSAKRIIWKDLLRICEKFKLEPKVDNTELTISFQNGSVIYVSGATDESDIEKFRGLSLKKVYIDEAQSFRSFIKTLVDDILVPALFDYDGSLCLIGTPGPVCAGYFYESCTGSGWSHHHWTLFDNPWIQKKSGKSVEQILAAERERRGITEQDPTYRRESLGQWVPDSDALAFRFSADRNAYSELPAGEYIYILGADIGWLDSDAIAVLGYNFTDKNVYLVEEFVKPKQGVTDFVNEIKYFIQKYKPVRMVMDAGALGKKIQEEIRQRHSIFLEAAEKHRKMEFVELLNDDLRTARFKAKRDSKFAEDCFLVQKDMSNPARPKLSDIYHTDIGDAVLYGWRECKHYLAEKAPNEPAPNSDAFMQAAEEAEAEQMEEKKKKTSMDDVLSSQDDMDSLLDGITDIYGDEF